MTIYVDELMNWGWQMRGRNTKSCHMVTDQVDLTELHTMAEKIGMRRAWFQDKPGRPHYDLTPSRREAAVAAGAIETGCTDIARILRTRRESIAGATP